MSTKPKHKITWKHVFKRALFENEVNKPCDVTIGAYECEICGSNWLNDANCLLAQLKYPFIAGYSDITKEDIQMMMLLALELGDWEPVESNNDVITSLTFPVFFKTPLTGATN